MSLILADYQYTLKDFHHYAIQLNDYTLDDKTIKIINNIAQHVGAPEYQKTPIFKRRERGERGERERPQKNRITSKDWEEMRNFKKTELVKSETRVDKVIDDIRLALNKVTETNFSSIKEEIIALLEKALTVEHSEDDLLKIGKSIFEIGSMNKFWTELYAKLYKDLLGIFPVMKGISEINFINFGKLFDNIRYVSPDENYDLFCEINNENDRRKGMSSFFVNLMGQNIISGQSLGLIVENLVNTIKTLIVTDGNKEQIDEISENVFIIMDEGYDMLKETWEEFDNINSYLKEITNMKKQNYPSLTNKTIFKFMDLKDSHE
tara:strand:- start:2583 stop:3545 length:963 start_codon:yes stop_codon:yes gene_type:complete